MAYVTDIRVGGETLSSRFNALRTTFMERREKRRVYMQTFTELSNLTDRDLQDLGIARSHIEAIAHEAAYK